MCILKCTSQPLDIHSKIHILAKTHKHFSQDANANKLPKCVLQMLPKYSIHPHTVNMPLNYPLTLLLIILGHKYKKGKM